MEKQRPGGVNLCRNPDMQRNQTPEVTGNLEGRAGTLPNPPDDESFREYINRKQLEDGWEWR